MYSLLQNYNLYFYRPFFLEDILEIRSDIRLEEIPFSDILSNIGYPILHSVRVFGIR